MRPNECGIGLRCHVNGRGITKFGTRFLQKNVHYLASSSVLLVEAEPGSPPKQVASGTLIAENVVLCAAHSLSTMSVNKIEIHLYYECLEGAAGPPPPYEGPARVKWRTCSLAAGAPQAKVIKEIESGMRKELDLDYSLLVIEWKHTLNLYGHDAVLGLPRPPVFPKPSTQLSPELLAIGHYMYDGKNYRCEPAQATAGKLLLQYGPYHMTMKGSEYNYASFAPELTGFSGGGVFNDKGHLVGVYSGAMSSADAQRMNLLGSTSFLDLGQSAKKFPGSRLANWVNNPSAPPGQKLLREGDVNGGQSPVFRSM